MENRTADIIQETRKHIKKKPGGSEAQNQVSNRSTTWQQPQMQPQMQTDQELQLKASRDVRWQPCITGSYNRNIEFVGCHNFMRIFFCYHRSISRNWLLYRCSLNLFQLTCINYPSGCSLVSRRLGMSSHTFWVQSPLETSPGLHDTQF